jgi:hypothetical protein
MVMSATRIVGIPCAAYPVVQQVFAEGWDGLRDGRGWIRRYGGPIALMMVSTLGAAAFFLYCLLRWGRWDLYMLTQEAGWAIAPDYLAVFKPASYRWLIPPLNDPTQWSQLTMTLGALCFLIVGVFEVVMARRRRTRWQARVGIYFAAFITYYISVSGVASVEMESMLRYQFCAHALIVLAMMHYLGEEGIAPGPVRFLVLAAVAVFIVASVSLQGWWIWNFTRGDWVA